MTIAWVDETIDWKYGITGAVTDNAECTCNQTVGICRANKHVVTYAMSEQNPARNRKERRQRCSKKFNRKKIIVVGI